MTYLDKIKAISRIKITEICKELKINRSNLLNGKSSLKNEKLVYLELKNKINKIINS